MKMQGSPGVVLLFMFLARVCLGHIEEPTTWQSCTPRHPQQHFCHSDFVILGKVLSKDNINVPQKDPTVEKEAAATAAAPSVVIAATAIAASTTIATSTMEMNAAPARDLLTTNGTPKQEASLEVTPDENISPRQQMPTVASSDEDMTEEHKTLGHIIKYRVKINKIYKGSLSMAAGNTVIIHSVSEKPSCQGKCLQLNEEYILSGTISGGDFFHHQCDWRISCHQMTATLQQQLRRVYSRHCNTCNIKTAQQARESLNLQPSPADSTQCVYNPSFYTDRGLQDCEGLYSACQKTSQGTCSWSRHQKMRECDSMRKKSLNYPSINVHLPCTQTVISTPSSKRTGKDDKASSNKQTSPDLSSSQIMPKKEQKRKRTTDTLPALPADTKLNISDEEMKQEPTPISTDALPGVNQDPPAVDLSSTSDRDITKQGTAPIFTDQIKQKDLPHEHQDPYMSDQASSDTSPFFSSHHVHMPHHAMGLPPPPVAGQEASDILDKITQQHLQKQRDEDTQMATSTLSPRQNEQQPNPEDFNTSNAMPVDFKTNVSLQFEEITESSKNSSLPFSNYTNKQITIQPTSKPNKSKVTLFLTTMNPQPSESSDSKDYDSDFFKPQFPLSGDDPMAVHENEFSRNPFDSKNPSSISDMADAFPYPPVDSQEAKGILEKITNHYREQRTKS